MRRVALPSSPCCLGRRWLLSAGSAGCVRAGGPPSSLVRFCWSRWLPASSTPPACSVACGGCVWSYRELFGFDDRLTATLDCTGVFFSVQEWAGARLDRLIGSAAGTTIRVVSVTGYERRFPIDQASSVAGDPCRRPPPGPRARFPGAPGGARWTRVLVGQMGERHRGRRRADMVAAAFPASVGQKGFSLRAVAAATSRSYRVPGLR